MKHWTSEQRDLATAIDAFCTRRVGSREQRLALTDNGREEHSPQLYADMADLGWAGITVPPEYGGSGGDAVDMCIVLERTHYGLAPISAIGPTLITGAAYAAFGSQEQKKAVLGGIARGESQSISMSEPEAGSDVANLSCRAQQIQGGWRISGQKTWCSNAQISRYILLVARTGSTGSRHDGLTMFHLPADTPGLRISPIETMGGREVNDLYLSDVELPQEAVVGTVGQGWTQLMQGLNIERLILAAMMLGLGQRAFDDCLAFVTQRHQFGRPIGSFQALRHRLADLATELACARLLVYDVAATVAADPAALLPREASMAKLKATETARRVALDGMQMMGGYGYATEFDMEGHVRKALVSTIYGGTSEIQRDIIGKTFGL